MASLHVEDMGNDWLATSSLDVDSGECVVVSGPSGAGKSLLLRAIADLDPHNGKVLLDGREYMAIKPTDWRRQVSLLAAESAWWAETVGEHIPEPDEALLEKLGFSPEVLGWSVSRLSTGEKQRLALARLLANRPRVLLLDEPTANLDPRSVEKVEAILLDYCKTTPAALVWVSHDPEQIRRVADRQYRFDNRQLEEVTQ